MIELTHADEYPIHQTPDPIAVSGTDPNFYDRYFFNAYSRDGTQFVAGAMGIYPHQNIIDAAVSVVHDGVQHSVFASRLLNFERMHITVDPISIEVVEPLRRVRLRVAENEYGISADLMFTGRVPPIQEPRFTWRMGTRTMMDLTRMTQNVDCAGWIIVNGTRIEVRNWWGTRDRSWGVRSISGANQSPFPPEMQPQFFWRWSPMNFEDHLVYYHTNDNAKGEPWNRSSVLVLPGSEPQVILEPRMETTYKSGTRHVASAKLLGRLGNGGEVTVELKPEWNFYMRGIGYMRKDWGHGAYHGEYASHYERFVVADIDEGLPETNHIQALCRAVLTTPDGRAHHGQAVLEQLIIGPYEPDGFMELFDVAPVRR